MTTQAPTLHLVLLVFAFVCFGFAAWQATSPAWNRVVAVGLAALTLAFMF